MKAHILAAGEHRPERNIQNDSRSHQSPRGNPLSDTALPDALPAAVFAVQAARLGLRTAASIIFPDEAAAQQYMQPLADLGIDVSACRVDSAHSTGHDPAARTDIIPGAPPNIADHIHIPGYCKQDKLHGNLDVLLERARANYQSVSLSLHWDGIGSLREVQNLLPHINVLLPGEQEAIALTNTGDAEAAISSLASRVAVVGVKLEDGGALLRSGAKTLHSAAWGEEPEQSSIKTDGSHSLFAEESFDAGLLYGYLKGWPLQRTLELAAACRALAGSVRDAAKLPDMETALQYIHSSP